MNPVPDAEIHDDRVGEVYLSSEEIAARVAELGTEIAGLAREDGLTVVMVTHDASAGARTDRLVRIRDGKIAGEEYPRQAAVRA
mgnify:CR=1 FL=1